MNRLEKLPRSWQVVPKTRKKSKKPKELEQRREKIKGSNNFKPDSRALEVKTNSSKRTLGSPHRAWKGSESETSESP